MTTEITTIPGPVAPPKESLVRDLKGIAGKADQLLKDAGQSFAEELSATRQMLGEKACSAGNFTQGYVRENPWKVAGAAAAVCVVIGALISRR